MKTDKGAESMDTQDKTLTPEELTELCKVSLALKTRFKQPSFAKTIKRLSESEMLDSIIAIAPQLATDVIGRAIIQTPGMIYYFSQDMELILKLAKERPWVIEAFNYIAAAVDQDKSTIAPSGIPNGLLEVGDKTEYEYLVEAWRNFQEAFPCLKSKWVKGMMVAIVVLYFVKKMLDTALIILKWVK